MSTTGTPRHPGTAGRHLVFVTWKAGNAKAFAAAKRLGLHVTLVRSRSMERTQNLDFDTSPYAPLVDDVVCLDDATDLAALRECLRQVHARRPVDGFLATVDALVVPVAVIAEELGIAFTSSAGAQTAKTKHRCREVLAAAGVDDTACAVVEDLAGARDFAAAHGFPLVLKPVRGSASEGAHVVADDAHLVGVLAQVARSGDVYAAGVLVEQYLTGRFVSAEVGLAHGQFLRLAVSERKTWAQHEALEVGTTIPARIDAADRETVLAFAERVVRALDLRLGVFHVEIMLGADGVPHLIEVNPRIMGSCLPNLYELAGGGDLLELLVRLHLGERVSVPEPSFSRYATVRWFGAAHPQPRPPQTPDLSWADEEYGDALHSLVVRFPAVDVLAPCRGNLGSFGEVQVVDADHATSIRLAEEIVDRVARQLDLEVTR